MTQPSPSPTLQDLARRAREINAANGWGVGFEYDHVPTYLALIHSEVSEAVQARSGAEMNLELGDVIVRALDLCELLAPGMLEQQALALTLEDQPEPSAHHPRGIAQNQALLHLHTITSEQLEVFRKQAEERATRLIVAGLGTLIAYAVAVQRSVTRKAAPSRIVEDILLANSKRGYRHGGRRI